MWTEYFKLAAQLLITLSVAIVWVRLSVQKSEMIQIPWQIVTILILAWGGKITPDVISALGGAVGGGM